MATAADKQRWDALRADYLAAYEAARAIEIELRVKYGDKNWRTWAKRGEISKLEKLEAKRNRVGDKLFELLLRVSPRGEAWRTGAPYWWILQKLTWEDATRPESEPLSVVVPAPYGRTEGIKETAMAKQEIDFTDEDAVLAELAEELDVDPDELRIKSDRGLESFGAGDAYEVSTRGGRKEWCVVENDEVERDLAIAIVKQDLEEEPENFNKDFIERHIDTDRLRRDLESDVRDMREEDLRELADRRPDDFWREYEGEGFDAPEEDEEGERRDPEDSEIEELAERQTEEQLKDPMEYLEDIYGKEDAVKQAIEIAGIDVDAAAEDAVDTDGAGHFLSSYDGQTYETKNGLVYWRRN